MSDVERIDQITTDGRIPLYFKWDALDRDPVTLAVIDGLLADRHLSDAAKVTAAQHLITDGPHGFYPYGFKILASRNGQGGWQGYLYSIAELMERQYLHLHVLQTRTDDGLICPACPDQEGAPAARTMAAAQVRQMITLRGVPNPSDPSAQP